jgi:hypothetical protein
MDTDPEDGRGGTLIYRHVVFQLEFNKQAFCRAAPDPPISTFTSLARSA